MFNLKLAIQEIFNVCKYKADQNGIKIIIKYDKFYDNYSIFTDQQRFQQVLLNLFSNAIKFTQHGGTVTISSTLIVSK